MIKEIQELNFPGYATMSAATVSQVDMGEWNITSQIKIDGQIAPDFTEDWEIVHDGHKYIMPLRKPQGSKENTTLNSVIDLTFQHWAQYQLKRWYFFSIQPTEAGVAWPDKYIASVSLNLGDFCGLFKQILEYYYGDKITLALNPAWQYKSEPEMVEISYSHIWDVLIKLYEVYGVRWQIEPNGSPDKYVIKVGYPTTEQSHIFEYGFEGGLLKVERQVQSEEIANMLLGRGGEKNLPYRYFKNTDPEYPDFKADPDWIEELANIHFTNLMPATFRSYVQGWKAAHLNATDRDGNRLYEGYTPVGEANAYAPWAYRKGMTDEKFDPVEYVADEITINPESGDKAVVISPTYSPYVKKDSSIAKYGPLLNGLENNDEIYPTIQGVSVDPYGRIDEVVEAEKILSDDVEGAVESDAKISDIPPCEPVTEKVAKNSRKEIVLTGNWFTVPEGKTANFDEGRKIIKLTKGKTEYYWDGLRNGFVPRESNTETEAVELEGVVVEESTVELESGAGGIVSASGIPSGTYRYKVICKIYNSIDGDLYVTVSLESPTLTNATLDDKWSNKWRIWVKNIWSTSKKSGETDKEYAERVWRPILGDREGNEAKVVFASGALAHEDYEFTITAIPKYERKLCKWQTVEGSEVVEHEYWSEWCIELGKSDADLESLGVYQPSVQRQAVAGDFFFFIGIDMPHLYTKWGEERVDEWKKDNLKDKSDIKPTWVVQTDRIRMSQLRGSLGSLGSLKPGDTLRLADKRFIEGTYETLYLSSLTITYREPTSDDAALNPDVEIVLSDSYEVSANPVATLQGEVSALAKQVGSISNVEQIVRAVGDKLYLRKDGIPDRSLSPTEFASLLTSLGFRSGMVGGAGWGIYKDANGNWVIEADRFLARQDLEVNNLVINQVKGQGGTTIESAAVMEITRVVDTTEGYVCYFDQHEGTVANLFHLDDVAWNNRYTPENEALKFYKRRVIAVAVNSVTLSKTDVNGTGVPAEGDVIVQYGNYTDKNRQYVKVSDVIGGGYERYIEGLDSVNAEGVEYYFIGRQGGLYNGRPRYYIGDENSFIEWINGVLKIKGELNVLSTIGGKTIGNYVDEAALEAAEQAKAEMQEKIDALQGQIDGVIESFNGTGAPTLNNYPANEWNTDEERQRHDRDIYTDITPYVDDATTPTSGQSWKWYYNGPYDYGWTKIADSEAVRALQLAQMSVLDTDVLYKQTTSQTDTPDTPEVNLSTGIITNYRGWSTDAPAWEAGKYIWQTTYVKKGDGTAYFSNPTCISGKNGADGTSVSISSQSVKYSTDHAATQPADTTFTLTDVPTLTAGQYLWSMTTVTYSNGQSTKSYAVSRVGIDGTDGASYAPNLLRGSKAALPAAGTDYPANCAWSNAINSEGVKEYTQTIKVANSNHNGYIFITNWIDKESLKAAFVFGRTYTLSFEYKSPNVGVAACIGRYIDGIWTNNTYKNFPASADWVRVGYTFVWNANTADKTFNNATLYFNIQNGLGAVGDTASFRKFCIVEGESAEWTPAASEMVAPTITSNSVTYAKTTANTQPADTAFTYTSIGATGLTAGDYLWTKTVVTYSDGSETKSYTVSRIGADGVTGTPGATGADGKTSYVHFAYASGVTGSLPHPTAVTGFSTTAFAGAKYIGVCSDYNQADPTTDVGTTYEWSEYKGDDGNGIDRIEEEYYLSTSRTEPQGGSWSTTRQPWVAGHYYWTRSHVYYTDGTDETYGEVCATGEKGESAYSLDLSNEVAGVVCDAAGNVTGTLPSSSINVYYGNGADSGWSFSKADSGCTSTLTGNTLKITALSADNASVTITATKTGAPTLTATMNVYKVKPGANGTDGANYAPNLLKNEYKRGSTNTAVISDGVQITTAAADTYFLIKPDDGIKMSDYRGEKVTFSCICEGLPSGEFYRFGFNVGNTSHIFVTKNGLNVSTFTIPSNLNDRTDGYVLLDDVSRPSTVGATVKITKCCLTLGDNPAQQYVPAASEMVGEDAVVYSIEPSVDNITKSMTGVLSATSFTVTKYKTTGNTARATTTDKILKYQRIGIDSAEVQLSANGGAATSTIGGITTKCTAVVITLYDTNGTTVLDRERIPVLSDASDLEIGTENLLTNTGSTYSTVSPGGGVIDLPNFLTDVHSTVKLVNGQTYIIRAQSSGTWTANHAPGVASNNVTLWLVATGDSTIFQLVSDANTGTDRGTTFVWNQQTTEVMVRINSYGKEQTFYDIMLVKGNRITSQWAASPEDSRYLRKALEDAQKENTTTRGGLILTTLIQMGYTADEVYKIMAGICGLPNAPLSIWAGGDMIDRAVDPINGALFGVRPNGTAYASGNTIRFLDKRIEVGDNVVLDDVGLTLFDSQSNARLRIANTPIPDESKILDGVDYAINFNSGSLQFKSVNSKSYGYSVNQISAAMQKPLTSQTLPSGTNIRLNVDCVVPIPDYEIGSLNPNESSGSVAIQAETGDFQPIPYGSTSMIIEIRQGSTTGTTVFSTRTFGQLHTLPNTVKFQSNINFTTSSNTDARYYLYVKIEGTEPPGNNTIGERASGTYNSQIYVTGNASVGLTAQTCLGNDGFASVWENTALVVKKDSCMMLAGGYGIKVTPTGIFRRNNGGSWGAL